MNALDVFERCLMAEEAIASNEIEGAKFTRRERFILKATLIWPSVPAKDFGLYFDKCKQFSVREGE